MLCADAIASGVGEQHSVLVTPAVAVGVAQLLQRKHEQFVAAALEGRRPLRLQWREVQ